MTDAIVARLTNVSHHYGATIALDDVTTEIPARRMVGVIGPDGVGKSTLLALISGVRIIQSGQVVVFDGNLTNERTSKASARRIAYMPQGLGRNLYPTLSVFENIDFFGRLFGQSASERRGPHHRASDCHGTRSVRRSPGRQAVRRDEAEAQSLLCADQRSGSAHTGRAHDRRRSAVARTILGPHQHDQGATPANERGGGDSLYGRSAALRLADGDG